MGRNNNFLNRLVRYFGLKILKILGEKKSSLISRLMLKMSNNVKIKYFYHIIHSTIFKREYLSFLRQCDFTSANKIKNKWAYHVLKYSNEEYEKLAANHYLWILNKYRFANKIQNNDIVDDELKNIKKKSKETFYFYGPNSRNPPNPDYKDCTLILTKNINENIEIFKNTILFLNSHYYMDKIANNKEFKNKLLKKYKKIYISSMLPIKDKEFEHSKMLPSCELGSSMALGRILYNLILKNGKFDCVIEGYDFYLSSNAYSKYHPTLMRKDNLIDESKIVESLGYHDPLYNFLIVKELSNYLNIIKSRVFTNTLSMSGDDYLRKLASARDFSLLK